MTKRTKSEIEAEIAALKSAKPVGPFARKTRATIAVEIEVLEGKIDFSAPEFGEMEDTHQMAANDALAWMEGGTSEKPSTTWGDLIKKP